MDNFFEIEKMNAVPGIYMIYNQTKKTAYIGQATDLKERMRTHIANLYRIYDAKGDNNANLQAEFELGNSHYIYCVLYPFDEETARLKLTNESLSKLEGIYFCAAKERLTEGNVHNIRKPPKYNTPSENELKVACKRMDSCIEKYSNNVPARRPTIKIHNTIEAARKINIDILDRDKDAIVDAAEHHPHNGQMRRKVELGSISIKHLLETEKLNHIMIGKMGDYIGNEQAQRFTDILIEKLAGIADQGKCLWATNCPNVKDTKKFIDKYGFLDDDGTKKVYALFALTSSKYNNKKYENVVYYWNDSNQQFTDTAPYSKTNKRKAMIINRFWLVEEDFDLSDFTDLYYRHAPARIRWNTREYILNHPINEMRQMQLCCASLKSKIINCPEIQHELHLDQNLIRELKDGTPKNDPAFYDNEGAVCYILAEIEDSIWMKSSNE